MIGIYQSKNPGVNISVESMPYPTVVDRLAAARPADALPDLLIHGAGTAIPLIASGDLVPVDDIVKQLGGEDAFQPGVLKHMSLYQGHYLSLPHYLGTRILIYRKDRLSKSGLKVPTSWDDFQKVAVALTSSPKYYGYIPQLSKSDIGGSVVLYPMALSAGGTFFNAKGDVSFNSAPVTEATEVLVELIRKAGGPGVFTYNINDNFNLVNSGKTSMTQDASAIVAVAAAKAPEVGEQLDAALFPHKNKPAHLLQGGSLMVLNGQNKNPKDAADFATFLMQPDNLVEFLHTIPLFMLPGTKAAAGKAFYDNPVIAKHRSVAEVSVQALQTAYLYGCDDGINAFAGPVENSHIVEEMLARIVLNKVKVADAVAIAHDQMADLTKTLKRRLRL